MRLLYCKCVLYCMLWLIMQFPCNLLRVFAMQFACLVIIKLHCKILPRHNCRKWCAIRDGAVKPGFCCFPRKNASSATRMRTPAKTASHDEMTRTAWKYSAYGMVRSLSISLPRADHTWHTMFYINYQSVGEKAKSFSTGHLGLVAGRRLDDSRLLIALRGRRQRRGACIEMCTSSDDCLTGEVCMSNGCGHVCGKKARM